MEFIFPTPSAASLPVVQVPKDVAIVAFHQATDSGMYAAKESYEASFEREQTSSGSITVLVLAKWIRAYLDQK